MEFGESFFYVAENRLMANAESGCARHARSNLGISMIGLEKAKFRGWSPRLSDHADRDEIVMIRSIYIVTKIL